MRWLLKCSEAGCHEDFDVLDALRDLVRFDVRDLLQRGDDLVPRTAERPVETVDGGCHTGRRKQGGTVAREPVLLSSSAVTE